MKIQDDVMLQVQEDEAQAYDSYKSCLPRGKLPLLSSGKIYGKFELVLFCLLKSLWPLAIDILSQQ